MSNKKNTIIVCAIISILIIAGIFVAVVLIQKEKNPLDLLVGTYRGTYTAIQGVTGLTLDVYKNDVGVVEAIFDFYPVPNSSFLTDSGKYLCSVSFDSNTTMYSVKGLSWINQPSFYVFVDLNGVLVDGKFTGNVYDYYGMEYGVFELTQI